MGHQRLRRTRRSTTVLWVRRTRRSTTVLWVHVGNDFGEFTFEKFTFEKSTPGVDFFCKKRPELVKGLTSSERQLQWSSKCMSAARSLDSVERELAEVKAQLAAWVQKDAERDREVKAQLAAWVKKDAERDREQLDDCNTFNAAFFPTWRPSRSWAAYHAQFARLSNANDALEARIDELEEDLAHRAGLPAAVAAATAAVNALRR